MSGGWLSWLPALTARIEAERRRRERDDQIAADVLAILQLLDAGAGGWK